MHIIAKRSPFAKPGIARDAGKDRRRENGKTAVGKISRFFVFCAKELESCIALERALL